MEHTPEQLAAIRHVTGPQRVEAGPGAGKTATLVARLARLIERNYARPKQILALTFTRAAADQMRQRLGGLVGESVAKMVWIHTFHALAYRLLREEYGSFSLWTDRETKQALRPIMRELGLNADRTAVDGACTELTRYYGLMAPLDEFQPAEFKADLFRALLHRYEDVKVAAEAWDFDDLVLRVLGLLEDPAKRRQVRSRWRYVLVDEFQDTNRAQFELLKALVDEPAYNVQVVGDSDQAIYSWRGGDPGLFLDFAQAFPRCSTVVLATNFRSTGAIVASAARLIGRNQRRHPKDFKAVREAGEPPQLIRPDSALGEDEYLLAALRQAMAAREDLGRFAILFRTNQQAYSLIARLERAKIPFRVISTRPDPFFRWMGRDAVAYIKAAWGEADWEEMRRVLTRPGRRGITKELVATAETSGIAPAAALRWLKVNVPPADAWSLGELEEGLTHLRTAPAEEAIRVILEALDYKRYIRNYCRWSGSDAEEAREILAAIQDMPERGTSSHVYLDLVEEGAGNRSHEVAPDVPAVTLSSFHGAKGLEWPVVYIKGSVEGLAPHMKSRPDKQAAPEEERRLFYVAMTRAKDRLVFLAPTSMWDRRVQPSRFLEEAGLWTPEPVKAPRHEGADRKKAPRSKAEEALDDTIRSIQERVTVDLSGTHEAWYVRGKTFFVPKTPTGRYYFSPSVLGSNTILHNGQTYEDCQQTTRDAVDAAVRQVMAGVEKAAQGADVTLYLGASSLQGGHAGWAAILAYPDGSRRSLSGAQRKGTASEMWLTAAVAGLGYLDKPSSVVLVTEDENLARFFQTGWKSEGKHAYLAETLVSLRRKHRVSVAEMAPDAALAKEAHGAARKQAAGF